MCLFSNKIVQLQFMFHYILLNFSRMGGLYVYKYYYYHLMYTCTVQDINKCMYFKRIINPLFAVDIKPRLMFSFGNASLYIYSNIAQCDIKK